MITVIHIIVAILSLGLASGALIKANKSLLTLAAASTTATLASGVLMVVLTPDTATQACVSGGVYLTIIVTLGVLARQKIARQMLTTQ